MTAHISKLTNPLLPHRPPLHLVISFFLHHPFPSPPSLFFSFLPPRRSPPFLSPPFFQSPQPAPPSSSPPVGESFFLPCHISKLTNSLLPLPLQPVS